MRSYWIRVGPNQGVPLRRGTLDAHRRRQRRQRRTTAGTPEARAGVPPEPPGGSKPADTLTADFWCLGCERRRLYCTNPPVRGHSLQQPSEVNERLCHFPGGFGERGLGCLCTYVHMVYMCVHRCGWRACLPRFLPPLPFVHTPFLSLKWSREDFPGDPVVKNPPPRASLVIHWLRIRLPIQEAQVVSLVREDPMSRRATKPEYHDY